MFADARTAARIDRAEARLSLDLAKAIPGAWAREIGGGAAVYARPRSPINKLIGAGFDGALDAAELEEVEAACRARGEGVRAELSELADPAALAQLVAR